MPTWGDDPSVLIVGSNSSVEPASLGFPYSVVLPGGLPPGDHQLGDVWDQLGSYDDVIENTARVAGDVDDDGHLDLWLGTTLWHGPFIGSALGVGEPAAWIEDGGGVVGAGFDADGDGQEDVLMHSCCQTAWVHYGPFEGRIAGAELPDASPDITWLGDGHGPSESIGTTVLRDHLGSGHHVAAVGTEAGIGEDTSLFDLMQPRGTRVGFDARIGYAVMSQPMNWVSTGDIDDDGFGDALWGHEAVFVKVAKGPIHGSTFDAPEAFSQRNGHVTGAIGDVDGDGVEELIGLWESPPGNIPNASWVVLFSPHSEPLDLKTGLVLGTREDLGYQLGGVHADLDGDTLSDLIYSIDETGEVRIWYGSDLVAAENERQDSR